MSTTFEVPLNTWADFVGYVRTTDLERGIDERALLFRGEADATWPIRTTLDRQADEIDKLRPDGPIDREEFRQQLFDEFKRQRIAVSPSTQGWDEDALELLARHHGLPSAILDWTTSPYIAAFFAMSDPGAAKSENVSIWILDRRTFVAEDHPNIDLIDDAEVLIANARAVEQQAVFLRILDVTAIHDLKAELGSSLRKLIIPTKERDRALRELYTMGICDRGLFRDLDGAARTAKARVLRGWS